MAEGTQKKLERVRPPRIQISYEVETGGAIEISTAGCSSAAPRRLT